MSQDELFRKIAERRLETHGNISSIAINLVAELRGLGLSIEDSVPQAVAATSALFNQRLKEEAAKIVKANKLSSGAGGYMEAWRVRPPPPTTPER